MMDKNNISMIKRIVNNSLSVNIANYFFIHPEKASWGPRKLDDFELIYQITGKSVYKSNSNKILTINANQMLLISPNITHTFSCIGSGKYGISCIHFNAEIPSNSNEVLILEARNSSEIQTIFSKITNEFNLFDKYSRGLMSSLLREILIKSIRESKKETVIINRLLHDIIRYLNHNFSVSISRKEIAELFRITPEYINSLFKKELNTTFTRYLNQYRIEKAKIMLLEHNKNFKEIAYECGFNDQYYFSRVFKSFERKSPLNYLKDQL